MSSQHVVDTNLLLSQVIGQVSDHDLDLRGNTIGRGATLTAGALGLSIIASRDILVGHIGQRLGLGGSSSCGSGRGLSRGRSGSLSSLTFLLLTVLQRMSEKSKSGRNSVKHLHHGQRGRLVRCDHGPGLGLVQRRDGECPHHQNLHRWLPQSSRQLARACEQAERKPCVQGSPCQRGPR